MKKMFYALAFQALILLGFYGNVVASVTLTSSPVAAANVNQATQIQPLYIVQMSTTDAATVNSMQFTLGGTHDANDLVYVRLYFNADNRFRWRGNEKEIRSMNLLSNWADKPHVRNSLAWETWNRTGHPSDRKSVV